MDKHTPTPWNQGHQHPMEVFGPDHGRIANCSDAPAYRSESEAAANADFIARVANTHEDLITSIRDLLQHINPALYADDACFRNIVAKAEECVARAEDSPCE